MASIADVRNLPPGEFVSVASFPDSWITDALNEAGLHMNEDMWNAGGVSRYDRGHTLLAAHLLTDGKSGGAGSVRGQVVSERLGPASRTYASPVSTRGGRDPLNLSGTTYGRRFEALRDALVPMLPAPLFDGVTNNPDA